MNLKGFFGFGGTDSDRQKPGSASTMTSSPSPMFGSFGAQKTDDQKVSHQKTGSGFGPVSSRKTPVKDPFEEQRRQMERDALQREKYRLAMQQAAEKVAERQRKEQQKHQENQRQKQQRAQQRTQERALKRQQEQARLETVVFEERQQQLAQRRADKLAAKDPNNGYVLAPTSEEDAYLRTLETPDQTRSRRMAELPHKIWPDETSEEKAERLRKAQDYRKGLESAAYKTDLEDRLAEHEDEDTIQSRRNRYLADRLWPDAGMTAQDVSKKYYADAINKLADYEIAWEDREIEKRLADWDANEDRAEAAIVQNLSADVSESEDTLSILEDMDVLDSRSSQDNVYGGAGIDVLTPTEEGPEDAALDDEIVTSETPNLPKPRAESAYGKRLAEKDNLQINWDELEEREEEGFLDKPHYPVNRGEEDTDNSGVTIGSGVDIGQYNELELRQMGIPAELLDRLKPGIGVTGMAAREVVESGAIRLKDGEARLITDLAQAHHAGKISNEFNRISQSQNGTDGVLFHELSPQMQTLMISIGYQYGSKGAPTFFTHVANEDWEAAKEEMDSDDWDMSNKGKRKRQVRRRKIFSNILDGGQYYAE